ncbi:MAG: hypothetical protein IKT40_09045 [Bacilli bacterium]|nr:hypothetical protein [Bacilli bacterium]
MTLSEEKLYEIINEEMTKSEISSLINNKIDSNMSSKDFEKKVKEITTSVISELFKILWQRESFWKNSVKR